MGCRHQMTAMNRELSGWLVVMAAVLVLMLAGFDALAGAEADYQEARAALAEFRKKKRWHKYRDKWLRHIKRFERIAERYPKHKRACDSLYNVGALYRDLAKVSYAERDRRAAGGAFEKLDAVCSSSSLADDGLYWAAVMHLRLGDPGRARRLLSRSLKRYSKGDMRSEAKQLLRELGLAGPGESSDARVRNGRSVEAIIEDHLAGSGRPPGNGKEAAKAKKTNSDAAGRRRDDRPWKPKEALNPVRLVVIDPGHGGEDDGAVGPKGTKEKVIVFKIAKRLKHILEKEQKIKVVLTRYDDKTMELLDRTKVANDQDADVFISIHCNAHRKRSLYGVETFYLNNSSDRYSIRLAKRENESLGKAISDLEFILTDLSMNANVKDSIMLANMVQKSMVKRLRRKYKNVADRGVRRAVFHVLLYARMPAVLVETSFISNRREERRLKSAKYQEELARGIAEGIRLYALKQKQLAFQH